MTIIDERGRVFGRVNAIDAAVALFVLILVPLAYGAYLLFRPPPVRLLAVEPALVDAGSGLQIRFRGENLRPFLTAQFGNEQLHGFVVDTPSSAEAPLPALPPGTYDLTLFSELQEVARLPNAITVRSAEKSVAVHVQLVGAFTGVTEERARQMAVGQTIPPSGAPLAEIAALGPPRPDGRRLRAGDVFVWSRVPGTVDVPAVVRVNCQVVEHQPKCQVGDLQVAAGFSLALPGAGEFFIDEVRGDGPTAPVDVELRVVATTETIGLMRAGDKSLGAFDRPGSLIAVGDKRPITAEVTQHAIDGTEDIRSQQSMMAVAATARLVAEDTPSGLTYRGQMLKVGMPLTFETEHYIVRGTVTSITLRR
jgi:hypothetical protein